MGLFGKKIEAKDIEGFLLRALKGSALFGDISYERAPNPYTVLIINKEDIHGLLANHIGEKGRVRFDYIDTKEMLVLELVAELPKEKEQQRRHAWWGAAEAIKDYHVVVPQGAMDVDGYETSLSLKLSKLKVKPKAVAKEAPRMLAKAAEILQR